MNEAIARQQFYLEGEAAYQHTLRTRAVYSRSDVRSYVLARVAGNQSANQASTRPQTQPLDAAKPMTPAQT